MCVIIEFAYKKNNKKKAFRRYSLNAYNSECLPMTSSLSISGT